MFKKRGQLTLFIILGIVLLFIFGFLLYARGLAEKKDIEKEITKTPSDYLQPERLNKYVSTCLDDVTKQGLLLIGLQGGNIFESQNGTIKLEFVKYIPLYYYNTSTNVSYGLIWDTSNPDFFPPNANFILPYYPGIDLNLLSYYGNNNLSYLCQPNGPNQETSRAGVERLKGETCLFPDGTKQGYGANSIQEQLSLYIAKKLKECIVFSNITELNEKIVEQGDYKVSVLLGSDDVLVTATIPLKLIEEGNLINKQYTFSSLQKVRLKKIYEFAHDFVELDKKNLKFYKTNLTQLLYVLSYRYMPGFSVSFSCPFCNYTDNFGYKNDQVVTLMDSNSKLYGNDYIFRFAIQNRYPVLENINTPFHTDQYDYIVGEGQTLTFNLQGYDPDENLLTYNYSGWKEDYDSYFTFSCCKAFGGSIDCAAFPDKCVINYTNNLFPRKWTKSDLYVETKKDASLLLTRNDIGFHTMSISTSDQEYSDWRDLNILVVDIPVAQAEYNNNYSDVPKKNASVEDPFILDATNSTSLILPISSYNWKDNIDGFSFDIGPILYLPGPLYNIENIKEGYFKNTQASGLKHEISLTVSNNVLNSNYNFSVMVYQCLNHKNSGTAPYPYNNLNLPLDNYADVEDPYLADHTCCENTDTYSSASNQCYLYKEYGIDASFNDGLFKDLAFSSNYPEIIYLNQTNQPLASEITDKDVFERIFSRNCSGTRGNVCDGSMQETRKLMFSCGTCSEPNTTSTVKNLADIQCKNYNEGYLCNSNPNTCISFIDPTQRSTFNCTQIQCDGEGNCDYIDKNLCLCSKTCQFQGYGTVEDACDSKTPGQSFQIGLSTYFCNDLCQLVTFPSAYIP